MIIELPKEVADFLSANPYFSNVPVVSVNEKDMSNMVTQYLAKIGIGVIVGVPALGKPTSDLGAQATGVYFEDIDLRVTVFEAPTINRSATGTNKWASEVLEMVCLLLHLHKPLNIAEAIVCVQGPRLVPNKDLLVYDCAFRTSGGVTSNVPVQTVIVPLLQTVNNGNGTWTVTISEMTTYAQVFYTTDGSFPSPVDKNYTPRVPYSAPFVVPVGTLVQARAYLAGYLDSPIAKVQL